jgi:predicted dehydrogenase
MNPIRTAVVGVGYLGRFHAQKYKALENSGLSQLIAVCDANPTRGKEIAAEIGVPFEPDFRKLAGKIDAVSISADTSVHYEVAKYFLSRGVHSLVEKPIATTSPEGKELVDLSDQGGLTLQVGHIEQFNPAWVAAKEFFNKPVFADFQRVAPYGPRSNSKVDVVIDVMIHDLELALSMDSSAVDVTDALGFSLVTDLNDVVVTQLSFESGFKVSLTASRVAPAVLRRAHVVQKSGSLTVDFGQLQLSRVNMAGPQPETVNLNFEKTDALLLEIESFLVAIKDRKKPRVTGLSGVKALQIAERVLGKVRTQKK